MADVVGNSAAAGFGLSAIVAAGTPLGPALGALAAIAPVASDVLSRMLSHRQRTRVERVIPMARDFVEEFIGDGNVLRDDGFFDEGPSGWSAGKEAVEGVLQAAQNAYEERKLPFLAHLLAAICIDPIFHNDIANLTIRLAEKLSWNQYVLLAAIDRADSVNLPDITLQDAISFRSWAILSQLEDLTDRGLVSRDRPPPHDWSTGVPPKPRIPEFVLRAEGTLLHNSLGLSDIGMLAIVHVVNMLTADDPKV